MILNGFKFQLSVFQFDFLFHPNRCDDEHHEHFEGVFHPRDLNTKGLYENDVRIEEHVGEGFVQLVERGELDGPEAERVVRASLQPLLDAGADIIVLGCTHYPFLLPVIERIAGPGVQVLNPAPAVARQLLHILEERGIAGADPAPGVELLSSGDPTSLHALFDII